MRTQAQLAVNFKPTNGNEVETLINGEQVYPRMLADLELAQDTIDIVQYGFRDGTLGRQVADILIARARSGVDVRLAVSHFGSHVSSSSKNFYAEMAANGVKIVTNVGISPIKKVGLLGSTQRLQPTGEELHCFEHRKMIVVDSKVAYTGGMGFEDSFLNRHHDVMVRMQGPCAKQLETLCHRSFEFYLRSPLPKAPRSNPEPVIKGLEPQKGRVTVIHNVPGAGFYKINEAIFKALDEAQESVWVMNPYLGDVEINQKLCETAKRGVKVRAVFCGAPENRFAKGKQRAGYAKLLDAGVEIYHYPTLLHAKVLVRDNKEVLVGSMNLDNLSTSRNFEIVVRLEDPKDVDFYIRELFEKDLPKCTRKMSRGKNIFSHAIDAFYGAVDRGFRLLK